MTEKGLVTRDHPGGGLWTEMDLLDVVRIILLVVPLITLLANEITRRHSSCLIARDQRHVSRKPRKVFSPKSHL